jgi:hypothetical protein
MTMYTFTIICTQVVGQFTVIRSLNGTPVAIHTMTALTAGDLVGLYSDLYPGAPVECILASI